MKIRGWVSATKVCTRARTSNRLSSYLGRTEGRRVSNNRAEFASVAEQAVGMGEAEAPVSSKGSVAVICPSLW